MVGGVKIVILVLSCAILGVLGKQCYSCNSYTDNDHTACIDPMSPYPSVNYTTCADSSVCTRVSYVTQKQFVVSRGCDLSSNTCTAIYNTLVAYYPDLSTFNSYYCTSDYCNSLSGLEYSNELK
ncbi:hypothetical protein HUJ04_010670 [Dendroctonus ponderosae]